VIGEHHHSNGDTEAADRRWLAAAWPSVRDGLPEPPGRVLEIGCGRLGGFVPGLRRAGYDAVGVDPEAPTGPSYRQIQLERYDDPRPVDAVVACTSLHHVGDLDVAADRIAAALVPGGVLVVMEWALERFDEATARWCFARLPKEGESFLHHHRDAWAASDLPWSTYLRRWAHDEHGLHSWADIEHVLASRFTADRVEDRPYFFATLGITAGEEEAAIRSGEIQAGAVRYLGRVRT
jgi:SAM-dependent methyltransferase